MVLKVILFALFVGFCCSTPIVKRDTSAEIELIKAIHKLSPNCKKVYLEYAEKNTGNSEASVARMVAEIHKNDPEIFNIWHLIYKKLVDDFKGSNEGKQFLKFYYASSEQMKDGSDAELEKFVKDVTEKWSALSEETKAELKLKSNIAELVKIGLCWSAPLEKDSASDSDADKKEISDAYQALPADRQTVYKTYFNTDNINLPVDRLIRLYARMHKDDPDVYKILKLITSQQIKNFKGTDAGREYLKFFYEQVDLMPDDSEAAYDAVAMNSKKEYEKLTDEDKQSPSLAGVTPSAKLIPPQKALQELPADRQQKYREEVLKMKTEEAMVRLAAKWHKTDEDLYAVMKLVMDENLKTTKRSEEAKEFTEFYNERVDEMKDGSNKEFKKFKEDVKDKWSELDEKTQDELKKQDSKFAQLIDP
ncbi:hypothetical protein M3Y97_01138300 [Aphelenchoides bicaudatus]|nr:hypothetical protein M3Y97_01138300 [Aphelenchoides bicaudatus]